MGNLRSIDLNLGNNKINKEGLIEIKEGFESLSELEIVYLNLKSNKIENESGVKVISGFNNLSKLTRLNFQIEFIKMR